MGHPTHAPVTARLPGLTPWFSLRPGRILPGMSSSASLTGSHLRTYHTLFQHPVSHNLQWHDVHALFRHLAVVEDEPNGNLRVVRNGQTIVLHPPRTKDVADIDELMALRHFLQRSETAPPSAPVSEEAHWLLVIDHHEARIFRPEVAGAGPQRIRPHQPNGHFRPAPNSKDFSRGHEKPDPNTFFASVAQALAGVGPILIFGSGTGGGNEMEPFIAWLKAHRPELARRIIGSLVVDESHLSEEQLLAKAREFHAHQHPVQL